MVMDSIILVLCNMGIWVDKEDVNVPLETLIADSIEYVSFIVELEKVLGIEIPDEFLQEASFKNLKELGDALSLAMIG